MSWLYEPARSIATKHNGTMRLGRIFGIWSLRHADWSFQGGWYMDAVWRKIILKLRLRRSNVKRVLVLGVALGSSFRLVHRAWPKAEIVGIDWEPVLHEIGKEIGVYKKSSLITFVEGDALTATRELSGTFDLVIVDLFSGKDMAEAACAPQLQDAVLALTAEGGAVAVNYYRSPAKLAGWTARFGEPEPVRSDSNSVALYIRSAAA